jgi:hypothetical protein
MRRASRRICGPVVRLIAARSRGETVLAAPVDSAVYAARLQLARPAEISD